MDDVDDDDDDMGGIMQYAHGNWCDSGCVSYHCRCYHSIIHAIIIIYV